MHTLALPLAAIASILYQPSTQPTATLTVCEVLTNPQKFSRRLVQIRGKHGCNEHECVLLAPGCKLHDPQLNYTWPATLPIVNPESRLLYPIASFVPSPRDKERREIERRSLDSLAEGFDADVDEMEIVGEIQAPSSYRRIYEPGGDPAGVGDQGRSKALIVVKEIRFLSIRATSKTR